MARILIIDDDDLFRSMLRESLALRGHTVIEASNGKEGVMLLTKSAVDLLITDIVMPVKDGLEVLMEHRKLNIRTIIIAMSGGLRGNTEDCLRTARHLGAAKVFSKPFPIESLIIAINELLASHGMPDPMPPPRTGRSIGDPSEQREFIS